MMEQTRSKIRSDTGKQVLKRIDERILERFKIQDYHLAASILDPVFKNIPYLSDYKKWNPTDRSNQFSKSNILKHFSSKFGINEQGPNSNVTSNVPVNTKNIVLDSRQNLLNFLEINYEESNSSDIDDEISRYLSENVRTKITPISWWEESVDKYPKLKQLFDIFLNIIPSSASSERAFKKSSKTLRHDRAQLCPLKVEKLCFINSNIEIMEKNGNIHKITKSIITK